MDVQDEIWRDIPGFDGRYQASSCGRIKSCRRCVSNGPGTRVIEERLLSPVLNRHNGYAQIQLWMGNRGYQRYVHRLVAAAFIGDSDNEVNHIDGIKTNNQAANLEYVTSRENKAHARRLGLSRGWGESHPSATLSDGDVNEIRRLRVAGHKLADLSAQFGVSRQAISKIARHERWRHLGRVCHAH